MWRRSLFGVARVWLSQEIQTLMRGKAMANKAKLVEAVAYIRTSSAANVGADKDSDKRQRAAIEGFAKANGFQLVGEFYDAAVSGADPIADRKGFSDMLDRIAGNGVRTILVESPDRFARDLAVQLAGHDHLRSLGITLIPASSPDFFIEDTPTAVLVRQVLGAIAQFEKATTVAKLRAARQRKKERTGKCEGRKSWAEMAPEMVHIAKGLRRRKRGNALRAIAAELAARGYRNTQGKEFSAAAVASMLGA
jgi:DNA invertase Pin-like site-specific DNA recombinase